MASPVPLVTRGLGPRPAIITIGFIPRVVAQVARAVVRHGRRAKEEITREIVEQIEQLKISAMLIEANGKELIQPIFNSITRSSQEDDNINITAQPQSVEYRKESIFKVWVSKLKIRKD